MDVTFLKALVIFPEEGIKLISNVEKYEIDSVPQRYMDDERGKNCQLLRLKDKNDTQRGAVLVNNEQLDEFERQFKKEQNNIFANCSDRSIHGICIDC